MNIKARYQTLQTKLSSSKKALEQCEQELEKEQARLEHLKTARIIIVEAANLTQRYIKTTIEDLVTLSLQSIYQKQLKFNLEFATVRNRMSCVPSVMEGDDHYDLEDDLGGGILDVTSVSTRFVLYGIQLHKSRPIFFFDEPLKFVGKGDMLDRAGNILRELSHKSNIQLIIFTHEPQLAEIADRAFEITKDNKISRVKRVEELDA